MKKKEIQLLEIIFVVNVYFAMAFAAAGNGGENRHSHSASDTPLLFCSCSFDDLGCLFLLRCQTKIRFIPLLFPLVVV